MEAKDLIVYICMIILFACLVTSYVYLVRYEMFTSTIITGACTLLWIILTYVFFTGNPELAVPFLFINQGMVMFFAFYSFGVSHLNSISLK